MYRSCLQACIACGYTDSWDRLLLDPPSSIWSFQAPREPHEPEDPKLFRIARLTAMDFWNEAETTENEYFRDEILAAVTDNSQLSRGSERWWAHFPAASMRRRSVSGLLNVDRPVEGSSGEGQYDGISAHIGDVDYAVWVMDVVGLEVWEREKKRQNSSFIAHQDINVLVRTEKSRQSKARSP